MSGGASESAALRNASIMLVGKWTSDASWAAAPPSIGREEEGMFKCWL